MNSELRIESALRRSLATKLSLEINVIESIGALNFVVLCMIGLY